MKEIKLSNSDKVALVDDEDYELISQYNWHITNRGYARAHVCKNKKAFMHRLILGLTDPKIQVDHKKHEKLDNRRSEIRICDSCGNNRNRSARGKSKYLGVAIYEKLNGKRKYITAHIKINGKYKNLGHFPTEELAALTYDNAAKIHYGEFANLNFPNP